MSFNVGPTPLRPYVVAPSYETFGNASASTSSATAAGGSGARSGSSSSFLGDLTAHGAGSSSQRAMDAPLVGDGEAPTALSSAVTAALLSFASTALVMPFDVGKILLQVQWIPRDELAASEPEPAQRDFAPGSGGGGSGDGGDELSDEDEAESYFTDAAARAPMRQHAPPARARDASGYVARRSVFDESTKPEYALPVVVTGGVWDMVRAIWRWNPEGFWSLWKGQLTTFIMDQLTSAIQPYVLGAMKAAFTPAASLPNLPLVHSPRPAIPLVVAVASHLVTGLLVSPLDLVRTRLVVQSAQPRHRKYTGPYDAIRTIAAEEGGALQGLYLHANLLLPAVLDHTVRPLVHLGTPLVIERGLGIASTDSALKYGLADFVLGSAGLLLILPIETVRRRLQIQSRAPIGGSSGGAKGKGRAYKACVETRPIAYAGVVEAVFRILTEETGSVPRRFTKPPHQRRSRGAAHNDDEAAATAAAAAAASTPSSSFGATASSVRQLFRGFTMGVAANAIVFALSLVTGESMRSEWSEM